MAECLQPFQTPAAEGASVCWQGGSAADRKPGKRLIQTRFMTRPNDHKLLRINIGRLWHGACVTRPQTPEEEGATARVGTTRMTNGMTLNNDIQKRAVRGFGGPALRPALASLPAQPSPLGERGVVEAAGPEAAGSAGATNEPVH